LVKPWGEYLNSDDSTTKRITMDVARLLIRTSYQQHVDEFVDVMVNGEIFRLRVLEDSHGPMRIIFSQNNVGHDRDGGSEEEEEEEEEEDKEEVDGIGQLMMEEVAERESEGDQCNPLAITSPVDALTVEDNLSVALSNNGRDNSTTSPLIQSGGKGGPGVEVRKKDSKMMQGRVLLGQEEGVGGPQNNTSNHFAVKGGCS
jgi:hypothetical protein